MDAAAFGRYSKGLPEKGRQADAHPLACQTLRDPTLILSASIFGDCMVKLTVRERESIQEAVRRFRKLVERSGIKKEMRKREFFEKPSETRRRSRLRTERRMKRNRLLGVGV